MGRLTGVRPPWTRWKSQRFRASCQRPCVGLVQFRYCWSRRPPWSVHWLEHNHQHPSRTIAAAPPLPFNFSIAWNTFWSAILVSSIILFHRAFPSTLTSGITSGTATSDISIAVFSYKDTFYVCLTFANTPCNFAYAWDRKAARQTAYKSLKGGPRHVPVSI